jgi:hypothetical protein
MRSHTMILSTKLLRRQPGNLCELRLARAEQEAAPAFLASPEETRKRRGELWRWGHFGGVRRNARVIHLMTFTGG